MVVTDWHLYLFSSDLFRPGICKPKAAHRITIAEMLAHQELIAVQTIYSINIIIELCFGVTITPSSGICQSFGCCAHGLCELLKLAIGAIEESLIVSHSTRQNSSKHAWSCNRAAHHPRLLIGCLANLSSRLLRQESPRNLSICRLTWPLTDRILARR